MKSFNIPRMSVSKGETTKVIKEEKKVVDQDEVTASISEVRHCTS